MFGSFVRKLWSDDWIIVTDFFSFRAWFSKGVVVNVFRGWHGLMKTQRLKGNKEEILLQTVSMSLI